MLEIDIYDFYKKHDSRKFSNSIAQSGLQNIGKITWQNALEHDPKLLKTQEEIKQARSYFGSLVSEWKDLPDEEIQALFIQEVSAQINEYKDCNGARDYERKSKAGQVSGGLFWHKRRLYIQLSQ